MLKYAFLFLLQIAFISVFAQNNQNTELDTVVQTGKYKLPAKVVLPKTKNFPIVIMLAGSGPQDKDVSIGPNKLFRDISEGFLKNNIASIRYDKRTLTYGAEIMKEYDSLSIEKETIEDALSAVALAVALAKTFPNVDKSNIWIMGHSLGAMFAPAVGANKSVKGIIMLAGSSRNFEDIALEQYEYIYSLDTTQTAIKKEITNLKTKIQNLKQIDKTNKTTTSPKDLPFSLPQNYWLSLQKNSPEKFAKALLQKPVLVLQGEKDYQVLMKDFELLKILFQKHKKASFISYPALNHSFMESKGAKGVPADYMVAGKFSEKVIKDMADFIVKNKK